jgi:hypothetical protein
MSEKPARRGVLGTIKAALRRCWAELASSAAIGVGTFLLIARFVVPHATRVTTGNESIDRDAPLLALPSHPEPSSLRYRGLNFCEQKRYEWCLQYLNHARRLDPEGDKEPTVVAARKEAEAAVKPSGQDH